MKHFLHSISKAVDFLRIDASIFQGRDDVLGDAPFLSSWVKVYNAGAWTMLLWPRLRRWSNHFAVEIGDATGVAGMSSGKCPSAKREEDMNKRWPRTAGSSLLLKRLSTSRNMEAKSICVFVRMCLSVAEFVAHVRQLLRYGSPKHSILYRFR